MHKRPFRIGRLFSALGAIFLTVSIAATSPIPAVHAQSSSSSSLLDGSSGYSGFGSSSDFRRNEMTVNPLAREIRPEIALMLLEKAGNVPSETGTRDVPSQLVEEEELVEGTILVIPPSDGFPNGTLVKLTQVSVNTGGATYRVVSERAALDELILDTTGPVELPTVPISFEGTLAPGVTINDPNAYTSKNYSRGKGKAGSRNASVEFSPGKDDGSMSLEAPFAAIDSLKGFDGSASIELSNDLKPVYEDFNNMSLANTISLQGKVKIAHSDLSKSIGLDKERIPLIEEGRWVHHVVIPGLNLPVVVTGSVDLVITVSATGEIKFEPVFELKSTAKVEIKDGKFDALPVKNETTGFAQRPHEDFLKDASLTIEGTIRLAVGASLEATLLDIIGIEVRVDTGPQFQRGKVSTVLSGERICEYSDTTDLELLGVLQPPLVSKLPLLKDILQNAEINTPALSVTFVHFKFDPCELLDSDSEPGKEDSDPSEIPADVKEISPHPSKVTYSTVVASVALPWEFEGGYPFAGCDFYKHQPSASGCGNASVRVPIPNSGGSTGWAFGGFSTPGGTGTGVRTDAPWFSYDSAYVMREGEKVRFDSYYCELKSDALTCTDTDTDKKIRVTRNEVVRL